MSKKLFTAEEIAQFEKSPYVRTVSSKVVIFTDEFKAILNREVMGEGKPLRQTLAKYGFPPDVLGATRLRSIASKLQKPEEEAVPPDWQTEIDRRLNILNEQMSLYPPGRGRV